MAKRRIYEVAAPDGSILEIEGPEGATEDQLVSIASQHYGSQKKAPAPVARLPELSTGQRIGAHAGAALDTLKDAPRYWGDAARSFAMGGADLVLGAGQLASKFMGDEQQRRYAEALRGVEESYQAGREHHGLDVGRFTGTVTTGAALGPARAAPTLAGRMFQGGTLGASLGAVSPVDPDANFALTKGVQVGGGALVGALAPPLVEGLVRAAGATVNAMTRTAKGLWQRLSGEALRGNVETRLSREIGAQGLKWSDVPQDVRERLIGEVQKGIRVGGSIDDESTRRLADFVRLKIEPTRGQVSRDPLQFAREVNLGKLEPGQPLAQRFTEQNRQLIGTVDDLRTQTGASGADPYAAGQLVITDLQARDAARKGAVTAAYTQARAAAGKDFELPLQGLAQDVAVVERNFGKANPAVRWARGYFADLGILGGKQTKVFSVQDAEQALQQINRMRGVDAATNSALDDISAAIKKAVLSADDQGGVFAGPGALAAQRFTALERSPALSRAVEQSGAPEKFVEQNFIRASIDDVANNLRQMSPQTRSEVRGAVLGWVRRQSVVGVEDAAKFTQAGYNRALESIGQRKLELIFAGDRGALDQLKALGRVGAYVQSPPVASGVNYSNTATTAADFLDQASRLPLVGLLGRPGDLIRSGQVAGALRATPVQPSQGLLSPALLDPAAAYGGLLSVPIAAGLLPRGGKLPQDHGGRN